MDWAELLQFDTADARQNVHTHVALVRVDGGALELIIELGEPDAFDVLGVGHLRWLDERALLDCGDCLSQRTLRFRLRGEAALPAVLAFAGGGVGDVLHVRPLLAAFADVSCCHWTTAQLGRRQRASTTAASEPAQANVGQGGDSESNRPLCLREPISPISGESMLSRWL